MKIKITLANNDRIALILPVEHAGLAATLLANAKVYERDGYYSSSGWKLAEEGIQIAYTEGSDLEPTHPKVAEAQKALDQKSSDWLKEYQARQAAEKELAETKAALLALQAVTVCTQAAEPAEEEEAVSEEEEE